MEQVLTFAFANGVPQETWGNVFAKAKLPPSTWQPDVFARELFVTELVALCDEVTVAGKKHELGAAWLERVFASPPSDRATMDMRREILRELSRSAEARTDAEKIFDLVRRFRSSLELAPIQHRQVLRRRLDILANLRTAIDAMATSFASATSELSRVPRWAEHVKTTDAWRALSDIVAYDEHLATVDLRVRIGADGRVRDLALRGVEENKSTRFAHSPFGRWIARLVLFFRGYRFDPEEILARAVDRVFEDLEEIVSGVLQLGGDLEPYLAMLSLEARALQGGLAVCLPDVEEGAERQFSALFNPLLLAHEKRIVACDLPAARADAIVLVTGPNSGGKTRLLQAIGIAQLLGQGGFFVPAASARIHPVHGAFASLGQAPAADATEGRLGTELLRVRALFETIPVGGMVLLDELCSGTNPSEGEELFQLVLALLGELSPQAFVSTHFLGLAAELAKKSTDAVPLGFLQVELDEHELPTYRFVDGVAKTSLAQRTAARLGVTREDLLALVQRTKRASRV